MKKTKRYGVTMQYVLLFGGLLLLTNIILGLVMMHQTSATVESLVRNNMLDITRTAAGLVNGDVIGTLAEEDVGSPAYQEVLKDLTVFQNNVDIEYIYAVRKVGKDRFIFTVDADPKNPAEFGEEVLVTEALRKASVGIPSVDDEPAEDEWGNFYSAYCPIFDSRENIAGIIGVDFDSTWYGEEVRRHTLFIPIIIGLFILGGGIIVLFFTRKIQTRLDSLNTELSALSSDVDALADEFLSNSSFSAAMADRSPPEFDSGDEIEALGSRIHYMQEEMKDFLAYAHTMAYTDALTGVRNTSAYIEAQNRLGPGILDKTADFYLIVFDINGLKQINDRYGHATGDRVICSAAKAIESIFGSERTYRIGGDEFLVLAEGVSEREIQKMLDLVDQQILQCNESRSRDGAALSLSIGATNFRSETDASFQAVFTRADDLMYEKKDEFHHRDSIRDQER